MMRSCDGPAPMCVATAGRCVLFMRRYPLGAIGALIMMLFVATALFADQITSYDPTSTNPRVSLARPGEQHMLGADFMGRDVFARIVYGARISLAVASARPRSAA